MKKSKRQVTITEKRFQELLAGAQRAEQLENMCAGMQIQQRDSILYSDAYAWIKHIHGELAKQFKERFEPKFQGFNPRDKWGAVKTVLFHSNPDLHPWQMHNMDFETKPGVVGVDFGKAEDRAGIHMGRGHGKTAMVHGITQNMADRMSENVGKSLAQEWVENTAKHIGKEADKMIVDELLKNHPIDTKLKEEVLRKAGWNKDVSKPKPWFHEKAQASKTTPPYLMSLDEAYGWQACYEHIDANYDCYEHQIGHPGLPEDTRNLLHAIMLEFVNYDRIHQVAMLGNAIQAMGFIPMSREDATVYLTKQPKVDIGEDETEDRYQDLYPGLHDEARDWAIQYVQYIAKTYPEESAQVAQFQVALENAGFKPEFVVHGTQTGRFSSNMPNMSETPRSGDQDAPNEYAWAENATKAIREGKEHLFPKLNTAMVGLIDFTDNLEKLSPVTQSRLQRFVEVLVEEKHSVQETIMDDTLKHFGILRYTQEIESRGFTVLKTDKPAVPSEEEKVDANRSSTAGFLDDDEEDDSEGYQPKKKTAPSTVTRCVLAIRADQVIEIDTPDKGFLPTRTNQEVYEHCLRIKAISTNEDVLQFTGVNKIKPRYLGVYRASVNRKNKTVTILTPVDLRAADYFDSLDQSKD